MTVEVIGGVTVLFYPTAGLRIGNERDAVQVVNDALNEGATLVAVAAARFDDMFFHLSTRMAGEFIQKFVNYRVGLAILGDISEHTKTSAALRSFVYESNRRDDVWFLSDADALRARLAGPTPK
jgi:hypothetical protein